MNKLTKGAIAASAALVLLLAGGGTLAYWNDTADLDGANITAGNLQLTQSSAAWTLTHTSGESVPVSDISAVRLVPGDKLTYTGTYQIVAQGDNLVIEAAVTPGAITAATAGDPEDTALASRLQQSATYTINGNTGATAIIEHRDADTNSYGVTIAVTLEWPFGDASSPALDNPAKLGSVDLSDFAVAVTQLDGTTNP